MKRAQANGLLLVAALIWGTAFVAQQTGMRATSGRSTVLGALPLRCGDGGAARRPRTCAASVVVGAFLDARDLLALLGAVLFLGAALSRSAS